MPAESGAQRYRRKAACPSEPSHLIGLCVEDEVWDHRDPECETKIAGIDPAIEQQIDQHLGRLAEALTRKPLSLGSPPPSFARKVGAHAGGVTVATIS